MQTYGRVGCLCFFYFFTTKSLKKSIRKTKPAILVIRRMCKYNICIHIFLFALQSKNLCTYSLLHMLLESINLRLRLIYNFKHIQPVKACTSSRRFTKLSMHILTILNLITWTSILSLRSGDVHPNPGGPSSIASVSSSINHSSSSYNPTDIIDSLNINHNLSFVQYNVQSILIN